MDRRLNANFCLGDFEVRPLDGLIIGPGGAIHLEPKVMEVLLTLVGRPGHIVTRAKLLKHVWGSAEGGDDALNRCISVLRHELDDHPDRPRYIQTIPKRGYRLVADVDMGNNSDETIDISGGGPMSRLWADLQNRRVFRVVFGYGVVAWILLQVADITFGALNVPDWALTFATILFVLGFPIAAILGWTLQVSDTGVVVDGSTSQSGNRNLARLAGTSLIFTFVVIAGILAFTSYVDDADIADSEIDSGDARLATLPTPPNFDASIAVLPFLNISENPGDDYIGHGIADELIHRLALIKRLKVAARTSSFLFTEAKADIPAIARELEVQTILEGSVRRDNNKIRVLAQLVDSSGFHLWSASFDREMDELLDVQSEIALIVAGKISISLTPENREMLAASPTNSSQAYGFYLQGRDYLRRPRGTSALSSAKELFDRALEIDPRFAEAYAALCETHIAWYGLSRSNDDFEAAEAACHRSRTLSDEQATTYFALGQLYRVSGRLDKAEDELSRGLELQPSSALGYEHLGRTYHAQNRLRAAEQMFRTAIELEPSDWNTHKSLGNFFYRSGRYQEAVDAYLDVLKRSPDNAPGYNNLAAAYYMLDEFEKAAAAWTKSIEIEPSRSAIMNTGAAYYFTGEFELAEVALKESLNLAEEDFRAWGRLGATYRHMPGREQDARKAYMRARDLADKDLEINPDDAMALRYAALFYARTGEPDVAEDLLTHVLALDPVEDDTDLIAALVYLELGRENLALDHLESGRSKGLSTRLISADPDFAPLRDHPRFVALVSQK